MGSTLVITNDFPPRQGGTETFVHAMATRMPEDEVVVYTSDEPGAQAYDATLRFPVVRDGALLLVYNVAQDAATAASLWQDQPADSALPPLLGRTRADVMECLRMTGTTGEIARRLRISNPAVSQHIGVLRRAGLVATERRHNAAVHTLTPLGEAVLG